MSAGADPALPGMSPERLRPLAVVSMLRALLSKTNTPTAWRRDGLGLYHAKVDLYCSNLLAGEVLARHARGLNRVLKDES